MPSDISNITTNALRAGRKSFSLATQNSLNKDVPGYSRVTTSMVTQPCGLDAQAVRCTRSMRASNPILLRQLTHARTAYEGLQTTHASYQGLQAAIGRVGRESHTLAGHLSSLRSTLSASQLVEKRGTYLQEIVDHAEGVAASFRALSQAIDDERTQVDAGLGGALEQLIDLLDAYHEANQTVMVSEAGSAALFAACDERDRLLQEISTYTTVTASPDLSTLKSGATNSLDTCGHYLLGHDGIPLLTLEGPVKFSYDIHGDVTRRDTVVTGDLSKITLTLDKLEMDVTDRLREGGGRLGALLGQRDVGLVQLETQLDQGAAQLADHLNALHNQGSTHGGVSFMKSGRMHALAANLVADGIVRAAVLNAEGGVKEEREIRCQASETIQDFLSKLGIINGLIIGDDAGHVTLKAVSPEGEQYGLAFCGLTEGGEQILTQLGFNDLFWGNETYVPFSDVTPRGFAASLRVNPRLMQDATQLAHGKLSDKPGLGTREGGTQRHDGRTIDALAAALSENWLFSSVVSTRQGGGHSMDIVSFARGFVTEVAHRGQTGGDATNVARLRQEELAEAYATDVGVDPLESGAELMEAKQYIEYVMTLEAMVRDLQRTLLRLHGG